MNADSKGFHRFCRVLLLLRSRNLQSYQCEIPEDVPAQVAPNMISPCHTASGEVIVVAFASRRRSFFTYYSVTLFYYIIY